MLEHQESVHASAYWIWAVPYRAIARCFGEGSQVRDEQAQNEAYMTEREKYKMEFGPDAEYHPRANDWPMDIYHAKRPLSGARLLPVDGTKSFEVIKE